MTYEIAKEFPNALLFEKVGPLISIYLPVHGQSEKKQDSVLFKNLARDVENELRQTHSKRDIAPIQDLFVQLAEDISFWKHSQKGLAIFASLRQCIVYRLQQPVKALSVVADSFHIKPLIRMFQTDDKYQLLGLDGNEFTLFEGNRDNLEELTFDPKTPRTINAVLGDQFTQEYLSQGTSAGSNSPVHHGQGGRKDEIDIDREKFFRYVDKFVMDTYSKPSKLPLVLVALSEHHNLFMKISNNPYLQSEGIKGSFRSFESEELREKAMAILAAIREKKTQTLLDSLNTAIANASGSDDLISVAKAAVEGRIGTLFVEAERIIPGKINPDTGEIELGQLDDPDTDDILDDVAELVLAQKGNVVVLKKETMISDTGIAALFRY